MMWRTVVDVVVIVCVVNVVWRGSWSVVRVIVIVLRVRGWAVVGVMVEVVVVVVRIVIIDVWPVYTAGYIVTKILVIVAATLLVIHQKLKCCITMYNQI